MDKEILKGDLGSEGGYLLEIKGDKVKVIIDYEGKSASAGVFVEIGIISILEEFAKKTDNTIDDALVKLVKLALGQ